MTYQAAIIVLGLVGFGVAFYIWQTVFYKKALVCPIGNACDDVVRTKYGKMFGFSNAILGMAYYLLVVIGYLLQPVPRVDFVQHSLLAFTTVAAWFSLYLIYIQGFILKKWCFWCVISALISLMIAIIAWFGFFKVWA